MRKKIVYPLTASGSGGGGGSTPAKSIHRYYCSASASGYTYKFFYDTPTDNLATVGDIVTDINNLYGVNAPYIAFKNIWQSDTYDWIVGNDYLRFPYYYQVKNNSLYIFTQGIAIDFDNKKITENNLTNINFSSYSPITKIY